jgi:ferredoxin
MSEAPGPAPAPAPAPAPLVALTGEQLSELIARVATRTEQRPRIKEPSYFTGDRTKLRIFLVQLSIYFEALGWGENDGGKKITYTKSLLREAAGQWLVPYEEGRIIEDWISWDEFVETIKLHFGDVDTKETARNRITGVRQGNRTMTEYSNEFRMIAAETEYDEGTLTRLLLGGMSKKLQDAWETGETDQLETTLEITRWAIGRENKHNMMDHIRKGRPIDRNENTPRNNNGTFRPATVAENRGDPMELDATRRRPGFNISAKEYQRRIKDNLCLKCAKPGHRASACRSQANSKEGATWQPKTANQKQWRPAVKAREMETQEETNGESGNDESPQ